MTDTQRLSRLVERATESLLEADQWERVRTAALVLELDGHGRTEFRVFSSDDRPWVLTALLDEAVQTLDSVYYPDRIDDDD